MSLLEIKNLSFSYDHYDANTGETISGSQVLDDISVKIEKGSFNLLCGKTGCGKSTLLKLIKRECELCGHQSGEVLYDGTPISELSDSLANTISILFQNPEDQIVSDKVWHEIVFPMENLGLSQGDMDSRLAELLAFFRLETLAYKNTCDLSGGQKQLLNLASVISTYPTLLLLDEPISQLDPESAELFIHTLKKLYRELNLTVVVAEHNIAPFLDLADRLLIINDNKLTFDGPVNEFLGTHKMQDDAINATTNANTGIKTSLTIKNLYFRYNNTANDVINNLCASFNSASIYSILGVNGAGKSTLLNIIAGINSKQAGQILPKKVKVAYLPQNIEMLFVSDTVRKELSLTWQSLDTLPAFINRLPMDSNPFDISGGEKQLLGLAKVLAVAPDIILLDEPTKGMDEECKQYLSDILIELKGQGKTIIISSHDLFFVREISDYCSILSMGRLTAFQNTETFFDNNKLFTLPKDKTGHIISKIIVCDKTH